MKRFLALTLTIMVAVGLTLGVTASRAAIFEGSDARVTTDRTDYQPGETVIISGTGFLAGENIKLEVTRETVHYRALSASADEYGNFSNKELVINEDDRGASFTVTATGETSGYSAQSRFTDGTLSYIPVTQEYTNVVVGTSAVTRTFEVQVSVPAPDTATAATAVCTQRGNSDNYDCAKSYSLALNGVGFPNDFTVSSTALTPTSGSVTSHFKLSNGTYTLNTQGTAALIRWNVTVTVPGGTAANLSPGYKGTIIASGTTAGHNVGVGTAVIIRVSNPAPVDNEAPLTTAGAVTADNASYSTATWTNKNVSVTLTSLDGPAGTATGVAKIEYNIDNNGYVTQNISPATVTAQHTITPALSTEGIHTLFWRATDAQGNVETPPAQGFTVKIDKTKPVITLTGNADITIPYGGIYSEDGATASDSGGSNVAGGVVISGGVNTNVVGDYTLNYNVSDNAGNAATTVTRTVHIVTADQTIDFAPLVNKTYGDPDFDVSAASGSGDPVTFTAAGNCTVTGTSVHITGAGSCTVTAHQAGNANYNAAPDVARSFNIAKASATVNVTPYSVTFDGNPHTATGSATGVGGENLSGLLDLSGTTHTNAGTYAADAWTFAGDSNYNASTGTVSDSIGKADATVNVTGYTGTYDGDAHGASGTAKGVQNEDLGSLLNLGATFTNVPGGTANWSFAGNGNYNSDSGTAAVVINKADATLSVNGYTGIYDGDAHGATGSATGVKGEGLSGLDLGASFTNVPGGTANWTFTDVTGNYNNQNGTAAIVINKANATVNVTGYSGTYDAAPHGATGSATGVQGETLSGLDLGPSFTNVPGGSAGWTFTDVTGNYNSQSGSVEITIGKADAVVSVSGTTVTYDGNPHGASGSATGVGGVDLSGSLELGASFTDAPGGTANWSFAGGTNYNDASGTAAIVINKASATINITPYSGVYDGNAHGLSGTATGVGNADLSSGLNLGSSFTNVPGGTASWTFSGGANYNDDAGSAAVTITKADATISVTPYSVTYDGAAHTATGTATGVGGASLSGLDLSGTTHTGAGTYNGDQWTFSGGTNYNDASGTVDNVIGKANATVNVTGYTGTYDGAVHGATGTATGAGGEDLSGLLDLGSKFTNAPGGTANWTFDGDANHNPANGTANVVINQKPLTVTASSPAEITYGDTAPSVMPNYSGFITGEGASNLTTAPTCGTGYAAGSNAGSYGTTCSGASAINYSISYVAGSLDVAKKALTVKADDKSKVFDGTAFTAFTATYTGFVLNQNQSALGGTLGFTTNPAGATAVGTYTITPGGLTSGNYSFNYQNGTLSIDSWTLKGFYQPVDMSVAAIVWNTIKGGSAVPLKFNIFAGATEQTNTSSIKGFAVNPVSCTVGFEDPVDLAFTTTGGTTLRYDATAGQFVQNWQTPKQAGQCLKVTMMAQDGSTISAFFKTK